MQMKRNHALINDAYGLGLRMPEYSFFIRSIRIRYLSGLLIFALASAAILISLNRANSFRHDVDVLSSNLVIFIRDLRNATSLPKQPAPPGGRKRAMVSPHRHAAIPNA